MATQPFRALQKYWKSGTHWVLAFPILLTLLFLGALFYLYVSQNYSYLVERNFRLLATWSKELTETLENYQRSFRFRIKEQESDSRAPIRFHGVDKTLTDEGLVLEGFAPVPKAKEETRDITRYKFVLEQQRQAQLSQLPFSYVEKAGSKTDASKTPPNNGQAKSLPPTVNFSYSPNQDDGAIHAEALEQGKTTPTSATIKLGELLEPIATEKIFSDVLLVDPSGAIIFQRNPSTLKFLHIGNLFHHQRIDDGWLTTVFRQGGVEQTQTLDPENLTHLLKTTTPSHFQIAVGGNSYEVFMQAVAFPDVTYEDRYAGIPWIICGILPSSTFQEHYLAIPFTVLLFCLFVLVSAFLTLPFFSLIMMNPRERLTRLSIVSLLITNLLGAGIGTLFLLDLGIYRQTVADFRERLVETADSVAEAFDAQLDRMVWQIDHYNQRFQELQDRERFPKNPDSKAWLARVNLPDPCVDFDNTPLPFCYPNFSVAFWVDEGGILRETWSQTATPYVRGTHDLRHRDYVIRVQSRSAHLHRRLINNRWIEFYIQPLISLESSTRSLVVSIPSSRVSGTQADGIPWVAAIQSEDFSLLQHPILAPGTGYAVVDNQTGVALFHSDGRRMLRENFMEETDNNQKLAALIHARAAGTVEGNYWGISHRFAVKPLSGLPWTLVLFESKEAFRTTNFEMLILSLSLFTLYVFGLFFWIKILTLVYRRDTSGNQMRWTWPKPTLGKAYRWLSLFQIGIFLLGLSVIFGMDWQEPFKLPSRLVVTIVPFVVIWIVIRTLWKDHSNADSERLDKMNDPWALFDTTGLISTFSRFSLATFLLLGVFPAILFFKVAYDQEMRLFAQHHLWEMGTSLMHETHRPWLAKGLGKSHRDFQFVTSPTQCLIKGCPTKDEAINTIESGTCALSNNGSTTSILQYTMHGLFPSFPLATCLSFESLSSNPEDIITPSWFDRLHQLIRKSSLQNAMSQESWGFLHGSSSGGALLWTHKIQDGHQHTMLRINGFPQRNDERSTFGPLYLSLWMPLFPGNVSVRLVTIICLAGLLILISYGILRYMIRKIYVLPSFFHRSHELVMSSDPPPFSTPTHLLVIGPPGIGKTQLAHTLQGHCQILDMHTTSGKQDWVESMLASVSERPTGIVLDHFEYQWEELDHRKQKGVLLERLLARGYQICILSTKDPLEWTRSSWGNQIIPVPDTPQAYWVDLLSSFGFTHFIPGQMEVLFQEWLHPKNEPWLTSGPVLPVKQTLRREAQPTLHLERMGRWIRTHQEWATWTPRQLQEQFLRISWPYYQSLWQSCSLSEKLSLYHLAVDGYLHTDNPDLTALTHKGLIQLTPELRVMNESFRMCILQLGADLRLSDWEKQTSHDTWGRLKWPFLFIFGTIILFFFFTQQEFKNSFITLVSLLPILLPALPDFPSLFTGQKTPQNSSG